MSNIGIRQYAIKAGENTQKVFNLLEKRKTLKTDVEPTNQQSFYLGTLDRYEYSFGNYKLVYREEYNRYWFMHIEDEKNFDFEQIAEVFYDKKGNLFIYTNTRNSRYQAIGTWLEQEGIPYYYIEECEWNDWNTVTNDINGELFKVKNNRKHQ